MRALGIVLVVFNLLAGGGFAYLAVRDWKGRQEITAAGLRHHLILAGLPLGDRPAAGGQPGDPADMPTDPEAEIPFSVELAGGVRTTTVSPKLLQAYFQGAGGAAAADAEGKGKGGATVGTLNNKPVDVGPLKPLGGTMSVPNQLAEVRRVYNQIKAAVGGADGQGAKTALLGGWLVFQTETYDERTEVLRLIQGENADGLEKRLYARFERVLGSGGSAAARDGEERRAAIAHLLVHLDPDAGWQRRVGMVVGLRRYVTAVAAQAVRFADMTNRVVAQTVTDGRTFEARYLQLEQYARDRTGVLADLARERAAVERARDRARGEVAAVQTQLEGGRDGTKGLRRLLQEVRAEVDGMLAQQTEIETRLFDVQKEVGLTLEEIYRLEAEVERLERKRFGKE